MLFSAFDVVVRRPSDRIDLIVSRRPPIHGTFDRRRLPVRRPPPAAATTPVAAS